jgi:hypothetical protein
LQGPDGPAGPAGPQGPAGAAATTLWAVVEFTGRLINSSGVVSVSRIAAGSYDVLFNQDVSQFAFLVTGDIENAFISAKSGGGGHVLVSTDDFTGSPSDEIGFSLAVFG